ncbi:ABC transporter permease [bacterium]|nr:ABC transporter permease [bacterium]
MHYLITFFIKNGFSSKRTYWLAALALIPPAVTLLLWVLKPHIDGGETALSLYRFFPQINYHLYLHFLLPLITVFMGTAVLRDEVEDRTLAYLITRPVPRWTITAAKMAAGIVTAALLLFFSLFLTWLIILFDAGFDQWSRNTVQIFQSAGVILLGLFVYIPLFTFFGGLFKRPVLAGLFFTFIWENTVSVFPGNVKLLTVANYLHVLSPPLQKIDTGLRSSIFNMIMPGQSISDATAVLVLFICMALFSAASTGILYIREYRLDQD